MVLISAGVSLSFVESLTSLFSFFGFECVAIPFSSSFCSFFFPNLLFSRPVVLQQWVGGGIRSFLLLCRDCGSHA